MSKKRGRPSRGAPAKPPPKRPRHLREAADSRGSTPTGSRCSSPAGRRSKVARNSKTPKGRRSRAAASASTGRASGRGYDPRAADARETEYHYGSDFGDDSDDADSDRDDRYPSSSSSSSLSEDEERDDDSDFSAAESGSAGGPSKRISAPTTRAPTPVLPWVDEEPEPLELPATSEDLPLPGALAMRAIAVSETLRRFGSAAKLSPFRAEDLCAALECEEHSALLAECHCAPLRALLKEADSQHALFGPIDLKDSINIALHSLDGISWPEVLRSFVESDPAFDRRVLKILETGEYPFAPPEDRLTVLEFLCDQFLATSAVRATLTGEAINYDDYCRICHRHGNLLCCETCPAVFHLECIDPPLVDIPNEDWQCALCESNRVEGTTDCISIYEKQGVLCRQERLGYDRCGRKYWFVARRLFVEAEDGAVLYYSTVEQLEELLALLDPNGPEEHLCSRIDEIKSELVRQMDITKRLTDRLKGVRKSHLEIDAAARRDDPKRTDPERKTEDGVGAAEEEPTVDLDSEEMIRDDVQSEVTIGGGDEMEVQNNSIDDGGNRDGVDENGESPEKSAVKDLETIRSKMRELSEGSVLFKLGNEGTFRNYVNHYLTSNLSFNKSQRNEDRDKKRHLANKFAIACDKEFKWSGFSNSSLSLLIGMLKQTLTHFESNISSAFMHPNWGTLRKAWLLAVQSCSVPRDFVRVIIVFQACIKSVVFLPVWHDQLGHIRLQKNTLAEREERKKLEKREKKEKEEEEERNKEAMFVKFTIPTKHQVWKQKGEEYRIHAQWGWLWHSITRKHRVFPKRNLGLVKGPQKMTVQIQYLDQHKIICLEMPSYNYLLKCVAENEKELQQKLTEAGIETKSLKIVETSNSFEELDIEKALSSKQRIYYPKIAKTSKLDNLLQRREQLKALEEKKLNDNAVIKEEIKTESDDVDVEKIDKEASNPSISKKTLILASQEIELAKKRYADIVKLIKDYKCYARDCNASGKTLQKVCNCYSPICIQKVKLERELLQLLKNAHSTLNSSNNSGSKTLSIEQEVDNMATEKKNLETSVFETLVNSIKKADAFEEDMVSSIAKFEGSFKVEIKYEISEEIHIKSELDDSSIPAVGTEMEVVQNCVSENDVGPLDSENSNESDGSEKESKKHKDYICEIESTDDDRPPIPKLRISTRGRTTRSSTVVTPKSEETRKPTKPRISNYVQKPNRRFCIGRVVKKEETIKTETMPDGSVKVYSASSPAGKVYLKHTSDYINDKKKKSLSGKYPVCSNFHTRSKAKSIMVLASHELRKLARHAGRWQVSGFNHNSKQNSQAWPYPCSRPSFKTCWLYRNMNLTSLSAVALQIKILWHCIRWDDMAQKPTNNDGKHQITTETEIITLEILKQRNTGQFCDKIQYLRRKVVIPLEVPKAVREVASIRSGLRKRKRAESPQNMEPQVTEEWVDEDKLELWEIKQFGERAEKSTPITRTSTGKLPPARSLQEKEGTMVTRATTQELREKMEQQLRQQRAAHQQKRALELQQVTDQDGNIKIINKAGATHLTGKSALTSLLTANSSNNGNKTILQTKRVIMTKGGDGTAKIQPITGQKTSAQSLIKPKESPQKIQIIRNIDGRMTVRGLTPGQQLLQTPDGKLHVVSTNQPNSTVIGGQVIATGNSVTTVPKVVVTSSLNQKIAIKAQPPIYQNANKSSIVSVTANSANKILIRPQGKPVTTTESPSTSTPPKILTGQQILVQDGQQIFVQPSQQVVVQNQQRLVQPSQLIQVSQGSVVPQNGRPIQTVVVQSPQLVQGSPGVIQGQQIIRPVQVQATQQQQIQSQIVNRTISSGQQIVINNPTLAQQFSAGKIQLATMNGQQVLIRQIGQNQAQIVAHLTPQVQNPVPVVNTTQQVLTQNNAESLSEPTSQVVSPQSTHLSPVKQPSPVQAAVPPLTSQAAVPSNQTVVSTNTSMTEEQTLEKLLAGQPPGTVIKTVTAQIVNVDTGPRIILQGLQGNSLTQQQLALVHQQVKQQLLKAQEVTGNQVVGPTKLYLAVTPSQPVNPAPATPPTLTSIGQHNQVSQDKPSDSGKPIVDVLTNGQDDLEPTAHIIHKNPRKVESPPQPVIDDVEEDPSSDKFVITPDYIQQTIRNALKQENLTPEIEEKLLQLQRYQEKQMKPDVSSNSSSERTSPPPPSSSSSRRKPLAGNNRYADDDEWLETLPRRRNRNMSSYDRFELEDTPPPQPRPSRSRPSRSIQNAPPPRSYSPVDSEERRRITTSRLHLMLFRHKEMLKKDIIKKRGLLEKELGIEIQKELSAELALRTRAERTKQEEVRVISNSSNMKTTSPLQTSPIRQSSRSSRLSQSSHQQHQQQPQQQQSHVQHSTPKTSSSSSHSKSSKSRSAKKVKLHCICQTPYDDTKFYVVCEHCNNLYHGDCVGVTEEMSESLKEFICSECKHAEDTQELYCLCRQPYDNSQFYICCDRCQDWFHGRCVGIIPSEADNIDEYICPNCQKNSSVNFANMKELSQKDFDNLKKMIKQIQSHRSAWPFMEPVDPKEAPNYYKVIKEPMDLQTIEKKINEQQYNKLSELISDMTKMFDNCRYFNPKDSQFYKLAETLENFFVQKVKFFREKLFELNQ